MDKPCQFDCMPVGAMLPLQWRHNERDGVSNHQPHDCLLDRLFRRRSEKTSKLRITDLCAGNSPVTGELTAQRASNAEHVSIWWRHHAMMELWHGSVFCINYSLRFDVVFVVGWINCWTINRVADDLRRYTTHVTSLKFHRSNILARMVRISTKNKFDRLTITCFFFVSISDDD